MFESIRGKNVLVTGGNSGLGAAMAELFAKHGANVGIHYGHDAGKAKLVEQKARDCGVKAAVIEGDLRNPSNADKVFAGFISEFKHIDVLINNAGGVPHSADFLKLTQDDWTQTLNLNLVSPFILARNAFRDMMARGGGRIINIGSISARYGGGRDTMHYGAAKAGLEALTKGMAREGARYNILVNTIAPGFIDTEFHRKIRGEKEINERIKKIPLQRAGDPIDIANMALFLASDGGKYITGQVVTVSGGD